MQTVRLARQANRRLSRQGLPLIQFCTSERRVAIRKHVSGEIVMTITKRRI